MQIDINLVRLASFGLFDTGTDRGEEWIRERCDFGPLDDFVVEPRYQMDIVYGAFQDGLTVAIDGQVIKEMSPA